MNKTELNLQNNFVWWASIIFILLLAFFLRVVGFAERPLWFDESIEYWMAAVRLPLIAQAVARATHDPPLYSYLLHFWMKAGINEFWLRLPSLIASMLSVTGIILLGQMLYGRLDGLIAGLILAVSAADIRYAQEVGQYSMMVCLTTWNLLFLYKAIRQKRWLWWGLWGLTALLNIYSHYGAAIVILATSATVLLYHLWQRNWQQIKRQVAIGIIAILLLLPLVVFIIPNQLGRLGATTQPVALSNLWQTSWLIIIFQLTGNPGVTNWPWAAVQRWWVALLPGLVLLISLTRVRKLIDLPLLLIIAWLTYYVISRTGSYFFLPTRHALLLAPLLVLAMAIGLATVFRWHRLVGFCLLLLILPFTLLVPRESAEDLRTVTQYWLENRQPDEVTYIYYGAAPGFRYQLDLNRGELSDLPVYWYGECYGGKPETYCREDNIFYGRWVRNFSPGEQRTAFEDVVGSYPERLWIVMSHIHDRDRELLLEGLQEYRIIDEKRGSNGIAILLERQ